MDIFDKIRANAAIVIEQFPQNELDYDELSVEWMNGFIERQRMRPEMTDHSGLSQMLGCFLGECIVRNFGGRWQETEYGPAVVFADGNACYPLNKTAKHFENGADDSVLSFYRTIPVLFNNNFNFGENE